MASPHTRRPRRTATSTSSYRQSCPEQLTLPLEESATEREGRDEGRPPAWGVGNIETEEQSLGGKELGQDDAGGGP